jgi:hypothetical protein
MGISTKKGPRRPLVSFNVNVIGASEEVKALVALLLILQRPERLKVAELPCGLKAGVIYGIEAVSGQRLAVVNMPLASIFPRHAVRELLF